MKNAHDKAKYDIIIIGAGSGGIATASSLLKRKPQLRIALIDEAQDHFYQPGWTMVGGGVFDAQSTKRSTAQVIPKACEWLQSNAVSIQPEEKTVALADESVVHYTHLVVAPGLLLDWDGVEGLNETLGKNGVTSNYRYDLAPYTWELVQSMQQGKAIFTQPPMPIKCAGAPQKALYLSASHWLKQGCLEQIETHFFADAAVLFGVADYVPALMEYVERYNSKLHLSHNLVKVDGEQKKAWFKNADGELVEQNFDILHAVPPQKAPSFIAQSKLANEGGWLEVDHFSLQHINHDSIWGVGDVLSTPNAKTMAAARKQAPVVAQNIVNRLNGSEETVYYNGYGSCPLTVQHGKIVLAEFAYGGKLVPSFPEWLNTGTRPSGFAWSLKKNILPYLYWHGMLQGREWLAKPNSDKE